MQTTNNWSIPQLLKIIFLTKPKDAPKAGIKEISLRVLVASLFAAALIGFNHYNAENPQAKKIKIALKPIASKLDMASKTGDRQAAAEQFQAISDIKYQLIESQATKAAGLRYCLIAVQHLSEAADSIHETGYWLNKDQYENSLAECK